MYPAKFSFSVDIQEKVVFSVSDIKSTCDDSLPEQISSSLTTFVIIGCWFKIISMVSESELSQFEPTVTVIS